jgi:hypothetical protein
LTSPVHYSTGTTCHVSPNQQTDTVTTMEASFGIDSQQKDFEGALLYKLQRNATDIDNRSNSSITFIEDIAKNIHFLVLWNVRDYYHRFCVHLIETTNGSIWDEDMLLALHKKYYSQFYEFHGSNINTWLIHGDVVIRTRFDVTYGSDYKLDVVISERTGKYFMEEPMQIDPNRSVMPLLMSIVLIYVVSLPIQP